MNTLAEALNEHYTKVTEGVSEVATLANIVIAAIESGVLCQTAPEGEEPPPYTYGKDIFADILAVFVSSHGDVDTTSPDYAEFKATLKSATIRARPSLKWQKADTTKYLLRMSVKLDSGVELAEAIAAKLAQSEDFSNEDKLAFVTDAVKGMTGLLVSYKKRAAETTEETTEDQSVEKAA